MTDRAKTPGQQAYERDVAARPLYYDNKPRPKWEDLREFAQWSWERNIEGKGK